MIPDAIWVAERLAITLTEAKHMRQDKKTPAVQEGIELLARAQARFRDAAKAEADNIFTAK